MEPEWQGALYRNGNKMMAVEISPCARDANPVLSAPRVLFERAYTVVGTTVPGYDVSADGQRFLMVKPEAGSNR